MYDKVKILVADDEEMNRELLVAVLEDLGEIVTAENGRLALQEIEKSPDFDLVLLDLHMPEMDGFETLKILKKHLSWREIPVIIVTTSKADVTGTLALGADDFVAKPYRREELRLRAMNQLKSKKLHDLSKDLSGHLEAEVLRKTAALREALAVAQAAEYEITLRLGRAAEFRDMETGLHTRRISEMSELLGQLAGLSPEDCELLRYASPLHDVGKVGIPDRILLKPGKLTREEMDIMRLHTVIGGRILSNAKNYPSLETGHTIALQHHEKWDGTGYPNGMAGEAIHIFARIVSIVDVYDALSSERPYKPPFSREKTLEIMSEGKGTFFDPVLLDHFISHIDAFAAIRENLKDQEPEPDSELGALAMLA
ncbi:HD-GYP domain-containing protein [Geomonas edaphica]|uniref:HD-GYP domain-containing protein n=1 Tax=Geomonas edaphica TaxID=2570226 RepID=UPI0010A8F90B|nr:HD domain-containing phosphohydrolase [Geomonas edaphica]